MKKQKWIGFIKYIGIDFDCKGNPLIEKARGIEIKNSWEQLQNFKLLHKKVQIVWKIK